MSKKKKYTREKSAVQGKLEFPTSPDENKTSEMTREYGQLNGKSGSAGVRQYLTTHWWAVALVAVLSLGALGAGLKYLEDDVRRQMPNGKLETENGPNQSLLNRLNPFITLPNPTPTPQLAREYLYAGGGRLLAVEDANTTAVPPADLAVWRPSNGVWYVMGPGGALQAAFQWGTNGDSPVAGDYDGDGKTDFSVFRPDTGAHTGTWYIFSSSTNSISGVAFGTDTDTTAMADYDGDGRTDIAVVRENMTPGYTSWIILKSSDATVTYTDFGLDTDLPAPADYDGDGKADITVWRNPAKTFYTLRSSDNTVQAVVFAENSTAPVSADYDSDGRADFAIRNGANWIIRHSSTGAIQTPIPWEQAGDIAVQNDYDGDGKVDIAVWRDATGDWYIRNSSTGNLRYEHWGQIGDKPVPVFYRR